MRRQQWTGERSCQASTMVYCNVQMESIKMFCVKSSLRRLLLAKLLADWLRPANRWKDKRTFLNCMCGAGETSATSHSLALSVRSQPWAARFMHKFSSHCFSIGARAKLLLFILFLLSSRVCVCFACFSFHRPMRTQRDTRKNGWVSRARDHRMECWLSNDAPVYLFSFGVFSALH